MRVLPAEERTSRDEPPHIIHESYNTVLKNCRRFYRRFILRIQTVTVTGLQCYDLAYSIIRTQSVIRA